MIKIKYHNEVDVIIECPYDILLAIQSHFTYLIKDFYQRKKFIKKWRNWDGRVKLLRVNKNNSFLPIGLVPDLINNFNKLYGVTVDDKIKNSLHKKITRSQLQDYIETLNLPFEPRDYQFDAFYKAIKNKKITNISPTSSGKSFIIYLYIRWFMDHEDGNIIIIVPRIQLVNQMLKDFKDYGYEGDGQLIYGGQDKNINQRLVISTWQSIYMFKKEFFDEFKCVVFDECVKGDQLVQCEKEYKQIKDIKVGDKVVSYNIKKQKNEYKTVLKTYENLNKSNSYDHFLKIDFNNGKSITVTPNHKIYTKNRGYVRADKLTDQDDISFKIKVQSIDCQFCGEQLK